MPNNPLVAAAAAVALLSTAVAPARAEPVKNVVLVHGAFADGSGWRRVVDILGKDGYAVSVVQEPLTSLADDVAATKRMLDLQHGPTLLVGHSYGGVVITEAGNAPNVVGLVYIAAFIPDNGESAVSLLSSAPAANNDMRATKDDFLYLDPAAFAADFAADLAPAEANFMAHSQAMLAKACNDCRLASEEELGAGRDSRPQHQSRSRAQHGQAGRQRNDRGSGQPRGVRFQAGGRSAFDRTGGKGVCPVTLPSTTTSSGTPMSVNVLYQTPRATTGTV
jgi:pimeloyl-ACP methyl ester carboxylesterase